MANELCRRSAEAAIVRSIRRSMAAFFVSALTLVCMLTGTIIPNGTHAAWRQRWRR